MRFIVGTINDENKIIEADSAELDEANSILRFFDHTIVDGIPNLQHKALVGWVNGVTFFHKDITDDK